MTQLHEPVVAVVVAAGSGSRFGASVPKALVELEGVSLVRRAVDALVAGGVEQLVVTIPEKHEVAFAAALSGVSVPLRCVVGGACRQESVRIGLAALDGPDRSVVLVHDAARALVPAFVIRAVAGAIASGAAAAVPVVRLVDSIRQVHSGGGSLIVDREVLRAVQTPQGARLAALRAAHELAAAQGVVVTDDAAVCELAGLAVELVSGDRDAMKITEPVDLVLAAAILKARSPQ